jgi:putative GTP pyrophosphokinase
VLGPLRDEMAAFMARYQFGIDEVLTKLKILDGECRLLGRDNPIEHIRSRVKSPQSLLDKIAKRGVEPSFEAISRQITDIAGVRVVCSFVKDVYRVCELLTGQEDVTVLQVKDYIAAPKPNGYRSLHALVEIPVFLAEGPVPVTVEVQFRTIAMDFWASLEHKIHYKYAGAVPPRLVESLTEAALTAADLDGRMERLHEEVRGIGPVDDGAGRLGVDHGTLRRLAEMGL